jgi:dCTP deaminase
MILTHDVILEEIKHGKIVIEPFDQSQVGPASVDLSLGNSFRRFKKQNGEIYRVGENVDASLMTDPVEIGGNEYQLVEPGETVLGVTLEKVTLPPGIGAWIEGRSRFARIGLAVHITSAFMHPGVSNHQVLEITNLGPARLALIPGTKICQLIFQRCEGEAHYSGRHQNQTKP